MADEQQGEQQRQQWEYATITLSPGSLQGGWQVEAPTGGFGATVPAGQRFPIHEFLRRYAEDEGWELAGVVPGNSASLLIFKRPKRG